jgi:2-dehydropantoate 2-reductase
VPVDVIHYLHPVFKSVAEAADRPYSHVLVSTKAIPELYKTSQILQPLFSPAYVRSFPQPTYVLMQNGLNVEVELYNALKAGGVDKPKILSTAIWIGTNLLAPNVVQHNDFVSELRVSFDYLETRLITI